MKTTLSRASFITLLTFLICLGVMSLFPSMYTGCLPVSRRDGLAEILDAPVAVREITAKGLLLTDGRVATIPYVKTLPTNSPLLKAAIQNGVEIGENGHLTGLIKVWHWCGNDPIRSHIGRVDLSSLCLFVGATPAESISTEILPDVEKVDFTKRGLNASQYITIKNTSLMLMMETETEKEQFPRTYSSNVAEVLNGNAKE